MEPARGQIWKEDDKRMERYVLITHVYPDVAVIITCDADGTPKLGALHTNAKLARFGKARGYKFVKECGKAATPTAQPDVFTT